MAETARLSGHRGRIDPGFVERDRTPGQVMALGTQTHLARLSLSNTVELLATLGIQRSRKTIHDRVQKADLQPEPGQNSNRVALDETVIRIDGRQYWLYAADPKTHPCFTSGWFRRLRPR